MELTISYVLSQVFIILNYVFLIITYQLKDRKQILLLNIASLSSAGLSYVFLSAYTGLAMVFVSILRNIILIINEKKNGISKTVTVNEILILFVIYAITIVLSVITFNGYLSLMSVAATMLYTYSVWQKKTKVYKWLGVPVSLCWITYNIYISSLFGIILETVLMTSAIIGYLRERK